MEGLLTNYYEYHFLYISGIHHVESRERPGHGPDEALLPSRHRTWPRRWPRRSATSTARGPSCRRAPSRRSSCGSTPAACRSATSCSRARPRRSARSRTRRCSRSGRCSPACRASRRRRRSAATSAPSSSGSIPTGCGRTRCRPTRWSRRSTHGQHDQPVGQRPHRRRDADRADQRAGHARSRSWRRSRSASAQNPTVYLRDVATVQDAADIPTGYALVNGRRAVYILVTKRADASTLSVVNNVKAALPKMQAVLPDDIKVSFEFDQSPYVTRRRCASLATEGALGRGPHRADGAALPARLAERDRRRAQHPVRALRRRSWRSGSRARRST